MKSSPESHHSAATDCAELIHRMLYAAMQNITNISLQRLTNYVLRNEFTDSRVGQLRSADTRTVINRVHAVVSATEQSVCMTQKPSLSYQGVFN